jgi:hypothetical protein
MVCQDDDYKSFEQFLKNLCPMLRLREPIRFMNVSMLKHSWWVGVIGTISLAHGYAASVMHKTMRVEHGRPVVVVSQKSVLLLEFLKEPIADALVPHTEADIRHCRARYRYQLYDGASGSITNGQGIVEEIFQTVLITPTGRQVKDVGSRVGISAGEFYLWWSEGGAGARSWVYYRTDSPIRFIQQPQQVAFESVDSEQFRRYLGSRNAQEFVAAGKTVQVIGPAVFSGDLPTDTPASARIESGRVRDGVFELKLSNLATNQHYIIESSYELKTGNWIPVHTFIAHEADLNWSDPLGKDVDMIFYRIREGAN